MNTDIDFAGMPRDAIEAALQARLTKSEAENVALRTALRDLFRANRSLWAHLHVRHVCELYDPDSGGLPEAHAAMVLLRELGEDPR